MQAHRQCLQAQREGSRSQQQQERLRGRLCGCWGWLAKGCVSCRWLRRQDVLAWQSDCTAMALSAIGQSAAAAEAAAHHHS
eukprot:1137191-Pelagomonas_calceolata.AAC.6